MTNSIKVDVFKITTNASNLGNETKWCNYKNIIGIKGWKYLCIYGMNNSILNGTYFNTECTKYIVYKRYKVYKAFKTCTKQQFTSQNPCYDNNICDNKYFNGRKLKQKGMGIHEQEIESISIQ